MVEVLVERGLSRAATCGPVRDVVDPGCNGRDVSHLEGFLGRWMFRRPRRVEAFTSRGQHKREHGIGVRGPEVLNLLDPLTAARHDLDRDRPGRRPDLANEPRDHPRRLLRRSFL